MNVKSCRARSLETEERSPSEFVGSESVRSPVHASIPSCVELAPAWNPRRALGYSVQVPPLVHVLLGETDVSEAWRRNPHPIVSWEGSGSSHATQFALNSVCSVRSLLRVALFLFRWQMTLLPIWLFVVIPWWHSSSPGTWTMGQIPEQRLILCQQSYKTPSNGRNEGMRMLTGTYPPFPLPTQTTNAPWSHPAVRPSWGREGITGSKGSLQGCWGASSASANMC